MALAGMAGCHRSSRPEPAAGTVAAAPAQPTPFCEAAARFVSRLGPAMAQDQAARAANTESLWRELNEFLREAAKVAPPDLRADADAAAAAVSEYFAALERARFAAAGVPRPVAAKLETPEFLAATTRLAEYSRQACGTGG